MTPRRLRLRSGVLAVSLGELACGSSGSGDADGDTASDVTTSESTDGEVDPSDESVGSDGEPEPLGCGNGSIEAGESCDGDDLGGASCSDYGAELGELACTASCQIDSSGCHREPSTGFASPMTWALPAGGSSQGGFYALSGVDLDPGEDSWTTLDLTGDAALDLVITARDGVVPSVDGTEAWIVFPGGEAGFESPSAWTVPSGGTSSRGLYVPTAVDLSAGSQSWATLDLTGDGRLDLVVTSQDGTTIAAGGSQHWVVHPGAATGFGAPALWSLPDGGSPGAGFYSIAATELGAGEQSWSTLDLTGDGRLDLVVTSHDGAPVEVGGKASWVVFDGDGETFGVARSWSLPAGGSADHGFYVLADVSLEPGSDAWTTLDLTGDGVLDLVVTARDGVTPHVDDSDAWIVFPGATDGFAEGLAWPVPHGGSPERGFYTIARNDFGDGEQSWATLDLTADGRPDLVVTSQSGAAVIVDGSPAWIVYPGTDHGFADPVAWTLPPGGQGDDSFVSISAVSLTIGTHCWDSVDLTADGRIDLVLTAQGGGALTQDTEPVWIVFAGA